MRRRGIFIVTYDFANRHLELLRAIQRDAIVMHVESNYATGILTFSADHPSFDELDEGVMLPTYRPTIRRDGDNVTVSWENVGYPDDAQIAMAQVVAQVVDPRDEEIHRAMRLPSSWSFVSEATASR